MSEIFSKSPASSAGSLSGASHTPRSAALRDAVSASRDACQSATGTSTRPAGSASAAGNAPSSAARTTVQSSFTIERFLIIEVICRYPLSRALRVRRLARCVPAPLERRDADAVVRVDEALAVDAVLDERVDHLRHDVGHFFSRERGTDHAPEMRTGRARALFAAERHLIPLRAVLVDALHADVADVVMSARDYAARDVERQVAEVVHVVEIAEAFLERERDRNRLRIRERAEIAARARDDVGQQADVRRRETLRLRALPQ